MAGPRHPICWVWFGFFLMLSITEQNDTEHSTFLTYSLQNHLLGSVPGPDLHKGGSQDYCREAAN